MSDRVTIVGGGIAGLSAARALTDRGWSVTVLERAAALPTTGTALGMWPTAMKALDAIGAGDAVRRNAARVDNSAVSSTGVSNTGVRTPAGRALVTIGGGVDVCLISRPTLLATLAAGMDITFNANVDNPGGLGDADVLVAADGTFSRARDKVFGEQFRARSLGVVAWRGTIDGAVSDYGETWAPGALFGVTPTDRDATNWYACIRTDRTFDAPHLAHLQRTFGTWHAGIQDVLSRIEEESILHHELFESPRLASYVSGNTALLGDAAHSMGPFLGRGACEALVDGVTLGQCLTGASTIAEGLRAYDRARRTPTQRLVRVSRVMGRFAMMRTGSSARNAALGAVGRVMRLAR